MFGSVERYSFLLYVEKESEWLQSGVKSFLGIEPMYPLTALS